MIRILFMATFLGSIFWAGYYVGQQPPGEVKHSLRTMSEELVERALGLDESRLNLQREFLEAKSRMVQGKSDILDGQYDEAAEEMDHALDHLKKAVTSEGGTDSSTISDQIMAKIEEIKKALASGSVIPREMLDDVQKGLDNLLDENV
ncbi:MAG: hypothetical protein VST68_11245 [Nitrospirota bacterium]|nr:hypothetical protein [Nitrospirota bacterium]